MKITDKAYAVPLHEQLANVPRNARLVIDDPDGMGTQFIPVGRYCHEAAEALRTALAQPEKEWVGLTKEELAEISEFHFHGAFSGREVYEDIETRLKEKNT